MLTRERTVSEIDFLLARIDLASGSRVLDVGCGFGRHAIYLAEQQFAVTAVDPSATMIGAAQVAASAAGVDVAWFVGSGESWQPHTAAGQADGFDLILCLFTTLGQIEKGDQDNRQMLVHLATLLRPGGRLVVEVPNRPVTVAQLRPYDRFGNESRYSEIKRSYDANKYIVTEHFRLVAPGAEKQFHLRYRLFDLVELKMLWTQAGLELTNCFAGYQLAQADEESQTLLLIGEPS